uniref:Coiled-coil domain-containing protein 137-like n=1 Tax=Phallusia mammillata TaxID=59560 RepID=A0A6F9D931_9ASCI|nr:coiled-coil domain-containing protein 137-like [Phallusia mammillata]
MGKHNRKKLEKKSNSVSKRKDPIYLKYQEDQKCPSKQSELLSVNQDTIKKKRKGNLSNKYQQLPGETDFQFLRRINHDVSYVVKASRGIPDTQPEIVEDKAVKKLKLKQKKRLFEKKLKQKTKLQEKRVDEMEKSVWKEDIKFGDVVLRPPELKSKPRKVDLKENVSAKKNFSFLSKFSTDGAGFKLKS